MVAGGFLDGPGLERAIRAELGAAAGQISISETGLEAIRGRSGAGLEGRVLASVRAGPGRTAYAIAKELGIRYPGRDRVKHDGVLAALERLQAAGAVRAEDTPRRITWWPDDAR